jgi:hypothetical protein
MQEVEGRIEADVLRAAAEAENSADDQGQGQLGSGNGSSNAPKVTSLLEMDAYTAAMQTLKPRDRSLARAYNDWCSKQDDAPMQLHSGPAPTPGTASASSNGPLGNGNGVNNNGAVPEALNASMMSTCTEDDDQSAAAVPAKGTNASAVSKKQQQAQAQAQVQLETPPQTGTPAEDGSANESGFVLLADGITRKSTPMPNRANRGRSSVGGSSATSASASASTGAASGRKSATSAARRSSPASSAGDSAAMDV